MVWEDVSFILRSPLRRKILKTIKENDNPIAPVQIAKKADIDKGNVSKRLGELMKKEMVECINPQDRKWRFYKITDYGNEILEKVNQVK